jgi:hypothetical protein
MGLLGIELLVWEILCLRKPIAYRRDERISLLIARAYEWARQSVAFSELCFSHDCQILQSALHDLGSCARNRPDSKTIAIMALSVSWSPIFKTSSKI